MEWASIVRTESYQRDDGTRLRLIEKELKALGGKIPSILRNSSGSTYTVKKGDSLTRIASPMTKGDKVKQIQKALAVLYFCPDKGAKNYGIDRVYGPKTANAVERYQSVNSLKADGIYGPKTKAKIESLK